MNSLVKDFFRGMAKNKGKFISVFFIILLGAAFFSGLRSSQNDMLLSAEKYYDDYAMMDLRIIGASGLSQYDVENIQALDSVEKAVGGYTVDVLSDAQDNKAVKLISYSDEINIPSLTENGFEDGVISLDTDECIMDAFFASVYGFSAGDKISVVSGSSAGTDSYLACTEFTVAAIGNLPYYMDLNRGTGTVGNGKLDGFLIVSPDIFNLPVYTEVWVELSGARELDSFKDAYKSLAESASEEISALSGGSWYILGRDAITSSVNFENDAERVASLGELLPIIFFLVAALVSLTAMTRLVEEERQQIGTLKALGCGDVSILLRYLSYALLPTLLGAVAGVLLGEKIFPLAIMNAYSLLYSGLPGYVVPYNFVQGLIAVLASVLCTGLATMFACFRISREKPAQIMRPEAPKAGKRVLVEKVPFIWKRLSFTRKATVRNMFRYKKRFFMTVIGVAGCMGLVMVGLGLHDSIMVVADKQFTEITHYQAAVTLSDGVSAGQREELIADLSEEFADSSSAVFYGKTVEVQSEGAMLDILLEVPQTVDGISDYFTFRNRTSGKAYSLTDGGALISEKTAKTLGVSAGDTVYVMTGTGEGVGVKISAVFENYIGHYIFISSDLYAQSFGSEPEYNQLLLRYPDDSESYEDELGSYLLGCVGVQGVTFVSTTVKWANDTLSSLNTIVFIVLGAAALLAFVVLYNLNSINIAERKRELATLKVLGFYDKEVASYVYKENMLLTLIGIILGIGVGILLHMYVIASIEVDLIMFGRSISLLSFLEGAAMTFGFSLIINLLMYRSLKKIDMVESLKSIE